MANWKCVFFVVAVWQSLIHVSASIWLYVFFRFVALQFIAFAVNNFEILVWQLEKKTNLKPRTIRRHSNQFSAFILCVLLLFTWPFFALLLWPGIMYT